MDNSPSQIPDNLCMSFCTGSALFGTGCLLTDIPCICASVQFENSYDRCTVSNCSSEGSQIAQQSHAQRCSAGSSVVSSTTSIQSQSPTGTTSSTLTTSNLPKSSNILIASSIPSASGTPTPPPPPEDHEIPVGIILGSIISTIVLVAVILVFWFRSRRRHRQNLEAEEPITPVESRFEPKDSDAIELAQSQPASTWPYCLPGDPAYESRVSFYSPSIAPGQSPAPMPASSPSSATALLSQSQSQAPLATPSAHGEGTTHQPHWFGAHGATETRLSYPSMSPSPSTRASVWNSKMAPQTTEGHM